jgi:hypothetical protein
LKNFWRDFLNEDIASNAKNVNGLCQLGKFIMVFGELANGHSSAVAHVINERQSRGLTNAPRLFLDRKEVGAGEAPSFGSRASHAEEELAIRDEAYLSPGY